MLKIKFESKDRVIEITDNNLDEFSTYEELLPLFEDLLKAMSYQFEGNVKIL